MKKRKNTPRARLLRDTSIISTVLIIYFFVGYLLGAFGIARNDFRGILTVGIVCLVGTDVYFILKYLFFRKSRNIKLIRVFITSIFAFVGGSIEYYMLNHLLFYWLIILLLVSGIFLHTILFWINLKKVIRGERYRLEIAFNHFLLTYFTVLFGYAFLYLIMETYFGRSWFAIKNATNNFLDSLYLSVATMTMLGYGDIVPVTKWAKIAIITQTIFGYFLFPIIVGLILQLTRKK